MRQTIYFFLFLLLLAGLGTLQAQVIYTAADSVIYNKYINQLSKNNDKPINAMVIETAKFFLGKPYVGHTLENNEKERLVVSLKEFDCTTFVETCIALSRVVKSDDYSFDNYINNLINLRYRNGEINGYSSRLHYVSDWKYENEQDSVLTDITKQIGGELVYKPLNFMSTHSQSYQILKSNPEEIAKITSIESIINQRNNYYIIPTDFIASIENEIKDGDIIAFATSIEGLDYSHIGIAYHVGNKLQFIHASSTARKVVIQSNSLQEYCKAIRSNNGISVFRLNELN